MFSMPTPSERTPKISSATPPSAMTAAPMAKPIATRLASPVSMSEPNSNGPMIPPIPVPTA